MNRHSRGACITLVFIGGACITLVVIGIACITLVVIGIASAGTSRCTDPDPAMSVQDEAVDGGFQDSAALVAETQSASDDISAVVDEMFRSIDEGAFEKLYKSSAAPRLRQVFSLEKFKAVCERVQSDLGALKTKQSSRFDLNPVEGSLVASASYQARFEHRAGTIFVDFERIDDDWFLLQLYIAPELPDDPTEYRERIDLLLVGVAFLVYLLSFVAALLFCFSMGHFHEVKSRPWNSLAPRISQTLAPKAAPPVGDVAEKQT